MGIPRIAIRGLWGGIRCCRTGPGYLEIQPIGIRRVLHIVEGRSDHCDPMSAVLSDLGADVVAQSDVFRALACLHRREGAPFGAVLVCVDYLASREFEFFSLVGRAFEDVDLLAYSLGGRGGRVRRAVSLGATGTVVAERASVAAVLGCGDLEVETESQDIAVVSAPRIAGEDFETESVASEPAPGPLLSEEEIRMLLDGGGEAEAVVRRKDIM